MEYRRWKRAQNTSQVHMWWDPLMFQVFIILLRAPRPPREWCWSKALSLTYSGRFFFFFKFWMTFVLWGRKYGLSLTIWLSIFCLTPPLLFKKGYFSLRVLHFDPYTNGLFWISEFLRSLTLGQFSLHCDGPLPIKGTKRESSSHRWPQMIVFP